MTNKLRAGITAIYVNNKANIRVKLVEKATDNVNWKVKPLEDWRDYEIKGLYFIVSPEFLVTEGLGVALYGGLDGKAD